MCANWRTLGRTLDKETGTTCCIKNSYAHWKCLVLTDCGLKIVHIRYWLALQVLHGDVVDVLLQELDLGRYVGADLILVSCGVEVTGQGVAGLVTGLVQDGQICPGGGVGFVQLYGTDICLQSIHRLVLLLIQHPAHTHMHAHMHTHTHTCTDTHIDTQTHTYTHMHRHTYRHRHRSLINSLSWWKEQWVHGVIING